jgi:hypothetical protein
MLNRLVILSLAVTILGGCASSQMKTRKEQRDKAAQSSKLYCDFVNGELYPDVEVMLNLEMAKRCDSEKAFSLTNYKTTNENMGIVFCCALPDKEQKASKAEAAAVVPKKEAAAAVAPSAKPADKAGDKTADKSSSADASKAGVDELGD